LSENVLAEGCQQVAAAAREFGVTMFLAPIADVVDGRNPWLHNRTMGRDAQIVASLAAAYIKGVQKAGITAVTKHFRASTILKLTPRWSMFRWKRHSTVSPQVPCRSGLRSRLGRKR
jgi:beta-N-acetylhexosaminidase